jgi:hypothetical protein
MGLRRTPIGGSNAASKHIGALPPKRHHGADFGHARKVTADPSDCLLRLRRDAAELQPPPVTPRA